MVKDTESQGEPQVYELGYLVLPSIAEDNLSTVVSKLQKLVLDAGGKALDSEAPEMIDLAYTMNKTIGASRYVVDEAYIGWMKFEVEASEVNNIKDEVEGMEEILRFLLIKAPRATTFTFAKARALLAEKAAKENEKEAEAPAAEEAVVQ